MWRRAQQGLDAEMRDHLDRETEENVARGMTPRAARAEAARRFGSLALATEDVRAVWIPLWLDHLRQDIHSGLRILRRHRSLAVAAVMSIALATAGSATILGLVDGLILHPFPLPDPDRIVAVGAAFPRLNVPETFIEVLSPAEFEEIAGVTAIDRWAAFDLGNRNISGGDRPERVFTGLALTDPFAPFGLAPRLGRGFSREELVPNGPAVAILSERLWRSRFNADPGLVGRTIRVNGRPTVVVGVMPADLLVFGVDLWLPWGGDVSSVPRNTRQFTIVGRLAPGASLARANAELSALASRVAGSEQAQYPEYVGWRLRATTWSDAVTRNSRSAGGILVLAVVLLVLVACANLSNLLLAHGSTREGEMTIRAATGATALRLARQVITEVLVIGLVGAAIGLAAADPALRAVMQLVPARLNAIDLTASLNWRVVMWTTGLVLSSCVVAAALPLVAIHRASRHHRLAPDTRSATAGRLAVRLRNGLTIAEVALAVTLVCGAALLTRSLVKLNRIDAGVDTGRVLTMRLTLPVERYRGAAIHQFFEQLVTRVRSLPGVQDAGVASQFPPSAPLRAQFRMDGPGGGTTLPRAAVTAVSKEALDTLRVPLIGGRSFDAGDRADTPLVAIVNETFARQQAENGRALGRTIRIGAADRLSPPFEIVGISRDTRNQGLRVPPGPEIFIPLAQQTVNNQLYLIVRAEGEPTSLLPALRHEIAALDPEQPIYAIQTLDEAFADETFRERASAVVLVAFAGIGLALAAIGIYGLMAFTVSTRRREIAVRMSLGADAGAVRAAIVGRGMRLVGIGAAAGIGVSLVVGRMMRGILYGVTAADPVSLLAMLAIVTLAGLAACLAPARRATAIDPASALRDGL